MPHTVSHTASSFEPVLSVCLTQSLTLPLVLSLSVCESVCLSQSLTLPLLMSLSVCEPVCLTLPLVLSLFVSLCASHSLSHCL